MLRQEPNDAPRLFYGIPPIGRHGVCPHGYDEFGMLEKNLSPDHHADRPVEGRTPYSLDNRRQTFQQGLTAE